MDYFLRRFPQLPYTIAVICSLASWALLCAFLGYFLILSQADFEATGTKTIFVFSFPLFTLTIGLLNILVEYGALRMIGKKEKRKELRVLNDNIKGGYLLPGLSTETLREIFCSLTDRPMDAIRVAFKVSWFIIFLSFVTEYIVSGGMTTNLFIIFIAGVVVELLLVIFIMFFAQDFISPVLKECRTLLAERGEKVKESRLVFSDLKTKISLSLAVPIFVVLVICLLFKLELRIVMFASASLVMAVLISRVLSFSISQTFLEIKDFTDRFSGDERLFFSTGSLNPEVVDLSNDLNRAAEEVYASRTKIERSKLELKERAEELEKWKELIVGRELKMVELKKTKKELELKLKNKQ